MNEERKEGRKRASERECEGGRTKEGREKDSLNKHSKNSTVVIVISLIKTRETPINKIRLNCSVQMQGKMILRMRAWRDLPFCMGSKPRKQ